MQFSILKFDYHYIDPIKLNAEIQKEGRKTVKRISCEMAEKEFVEKYIRTMTPVLIQGCDFEWLNTVNLNLPSAAKVSTSINYCIFQYLNNDYNQYNMSGSQ